MTSDVSDVLETFSKFLKPEIAKKSIFSKKNGKIKPQSIEELLKLPIYSFNFLNEQEAKIMEDILDIFDIGEAAKLDKKNPFNKIIDHESTDDPIGSIETQKKLEQQIDVLKNKFPDFEEHLKKAITISSLILEIKESNARIKKSEQKVIVVGLDNAGKTAILKKFGGSLGISDLAKLQPTKGVERKLIKSQGLDLYVWDLGGQEKYRREYLEHVNQYFLELDLLIYLIDVQDSARFEESFSYFEKLLGILDTLEENPHILIFLHKYDPDLKESPELKLNVEFLRDQIQDLFSDKDFQFELYLTSIFSMISREPQFSKYIKELMNTNALSDPMVKKVEGLGGILEEIMNAIIRLSESLSSQLANMDERLRAIESGTAGLAPKGVPQIIKTHQVEHREENVRATVLSELKDLFNKKKKLNL